MDSGTGSCARKWWGLSRKNSRCWANLTHNEAVDALVVFARLLVAMVRMLEAVLTRKASVWVVVSLDGYPSTG